MFLGYSLPSGYKKVFIVYHNNKTIDIRSHNILVKSMFNAVVSIEIDYYHLIVVLSNAPMKLISKHFLLLQCESGILLGLFVICCT